MFDNVVYCKTQCSFPQTVGSIWHSIFDDVSSAYHQKVAKDRATKDGLVVNPPSLGNLPGEGDVTYASEVKDVLIPYTTREDTYNYYEERNYVNDVNRKHTEVLQNYDHELKARETYSYGHGRNSYLNNQTNKQQVLPLFDRPVRVSDRSNPRR